MAALLSRSDYHNSNKETDIMLKRSNFHGLWLATAIFALTVLPNDADATIVEFQTVLGDFQVNLYDTDTPQTVANFLNYTNNGAFTNSIFHRSAPGFVVQGGGFTLDANFVPVGIPANAAVANEPVFSNVRGTISMAKLSGNPDSATSQWFVNLANNSANLDGQNGGFTAFGEVIGNGMDVVDAIAALQRFDFRTRFGSAFGELPLQGYSAADFNNNVALDATNPVIVTGIVVIDTTVDTATGLNPPLNTANSGGGGGGGGGGGAVAAAVAVAAAAWATSDYSYCSCPLAGECCAAAWPGNDVDCPHPVRGRRWQTQTALRSDQRPGQQRR